MLPPIQPFHSANRFITSMAFGVIVYQVLKIFEELIFSGQNSNDGIIVDLIKRIVTIVVAG